MKYFKILIITFLIFSCSKDSEKELLSSEKSVFSYSIKEKPNLIFSGFSQNQLQANFDQPLASKEFTAVFTVSEKASVYIGNELQISGSTINDFSEPVTYRIVAEDESQTNFLVNINSFPNQDPMAVVEGDRVYYVQNNTDSAEVELTAAASTDIEESDLSFEWILDNNILSTDEIANFILPFGIHDIQLTVTDDQGATDVASIQVQIRQLGLRYPVSPMASVQTINVLNHLSAIAASDQFAFGQEFPLSFQLNELSYDLNTSDCKDVSGDHPAVFGIDPHYILYRTPAQRQLHIDEAKKAYENGAIVTFDFHQRSPADKKIYYDEITTETDKSLMYDVVNDLNGAREWYFSEMDEILDIIDNELGFTVTFRLLHEMNGNWFWWGTRTENHSAELYVALYRMTVDYLNDRTGNILFAWSPNVTLDQSYYPGDDYVDVVGIDYYIPSRDQLKDALIDLTNFAELHNKVAAFTETGEQQYHSSNPDFWTDNILSVIEEGGEEIKLAWVLAWFNAPWDSSQDNLFIPNVQSPQNVKDDFVEFKNSERSLFMEDIEAMNVYSPIQ